MSTQSNLHSTNLSRPSVGKLAKIGAWLFVLWGVLHVWVGYEGIHQYTTLGTTGLWNTVIGGSYVPRSAFVHTADTVTSFAQGQLLLNFCIDVGGYGILGMIIGWLILKHASWTAYFLGVFVIGIADLTFLFAMVMPGVIELNAGTIGGPILWFAAICLTPFGMPKLSKYSINEITN